MVGNSLIWLTHPTGFACQSPHHPIHPSRLHAFKAPGTEGAAGFGAVFVDAAGGLAAPEVEMDAVAAFEAHEGAPLFREEACLRQGTGGVLGEAFEIAGVPAETAGAAELGCQTTHQTWNCARKAPPPGPRLSPLPAARRDLR